MSDSEQEQGKASRSTKTKQFWIGVSLVTLLIFSAINIFVTVFAMPKFEQIFADTTPHDLSLPVLTQFVLLFRIPLAVVAASWPLLGTIVAWRRKNRPLLWFNIALILTHLQIAITVSALFMGMWEISGIITGMSDSTHP